MEADPQQEDKKYSQQTILLFILTITKYYDKRDNSNGNNDYGSIDSGAVTNANDEYDGDMIVIKLYIATTKRLTRAPCPGTGARYPFYLNAFD